jgi:hypothetical protein
LPTPRLQVPQLFRKVRLQHVEAGHVALEEEQVVEEPRLQRLRRIFLLTAGFRWSSTQLPIL